MTHLMPALTAAILAATGATVAPVANIPTPPTMEAGSAIDISSPLANVLPIKVVSHCTLGGITQSGYGITAGHCGVRGSVVYSGHRVVGRIVHQSVDHGDFAIIKFSQSVPLHKSAISYQIPPVNLQVSKLGSTTGKSYGAIVTRPQVTHNLMYPIRPGSLIPLYHNVSTVGQLSTLCTRQGDSGGPVFNRTTGKVVAILVGSTATHADSTTACRTHGEGTLIAPLAHMPRQYR